MKGHPLSHCPDAATAHPQTVMNDGSQSLIKIKYFQNFGLYIIYVLALYL